ncbi:MAG TPA: hypothetical protein ENI78_00200 [Euryarchaeota archaeon]|nr:hypothetical protein [Euryarchaeota archaeon]
MAGMSSFLLKGLGVLLVFIGLLGVFGSIAGIMMVHGHKFGSIGIKEEVQQVSGQLTDKEIKLKESFDLTRKGMLGASASVSSAGAAVNKASGTLALASESTKAASSDINEASNNQRSAALLLHEASQQLDSWADSYSYNGTPLPQKADFESAVSKIDAASEKLSSSGDNLASTSTQLDYTASNLYASSSNLGATSKSLANMSKNLKSSGDSFLNIEKPLTVLINNMVSILNSAKNSIETLSRASASIKLGLYVLLSYMFLFHLIMLLLGLALIIIDINLFY